MDGEEEVVDHHKLATALHPVNTTHILKYIRRPERQVTLSVKYFTKKDGSNLACITVPNRSAHLVLHLMHLGNIGRAQVNLWKQKLKNNVKTRSIKSMIDYLIT